MPLHEIFSRTIETIQFVNIIDINYFSNELKEKSAYAFKYKLDCMKFIYAGLCGSRSRFKMI